MNVQSLYLQSLGKMRVEKGVGGEWGVESGGENGDWGALVQKKARGNTHNHRAFPCTLTHTQC